MKSLSTNNKSNFLSRDISQRFFNILIIFTFFLLASVLITLLIAGPKDSSATQQSASAGSSVYYASISNDDTVTIPVTPTSTQSEYTATNNIKFTSTCTKGAYVYINTNSSTNNSLTRTGSDTGVKTIPAVAGASGLTNNTWGFKVTGKAFTQVPVSSSPAVLYSSTIQETNRDIDVTYGVKVDNTIPSGTYTNDVVYTVAVAPECLAYTLKFNTNGGSAISDASINYGDTVNLNNYTTSRSGYIFGGWNNGSNDFTGKEIAANPNPGNNFTVTLSACWVKNTPYAYDYTGNEQTFTAPCNGYYKLEVWGAQGTVARATDNQKTLGTGGYGGYAIGVLNQSKNSALYVNVGGQGEYAATAPADIPSASTNWAGYVAYLNSHFGGYNGGAGVDGLWFSYAGSGGATHIATRSGLLKDLESYKGTLVNNSYYNSSVIMIVAGGGGLYTAHSATYSDKNCPTADMGSSNGGGYKGGGRNSLGGTQINGGVSQITDPTTGTVYTEDCNGKFGQGCGVHVYGQSSSAGGGGFYGGAGFNNLFECGGGGSGYIASSSLISGGGITKHMTGYSIPTSTAAATRTNSNTNVSATATADYSKTGNGYAKITYLGVSV